MINYKSTYHIRITAIISTIILFFTEKPIAQILPNDTVFPFKIIAIDDTINEVIFNNTNVPYLVENNNEVLSKIKIAVKKQLGLRIETNEYGLILSVTPIDIDNRNLFYIKHDTLSYNKFKYDDDKSFKKNERKYLNELKFEAQTLNTEIEYDTLLRIFDYFKSLSCEQVNSCNSDNPCVTFDYKNDGCYARAHYMKKIFEENKYACKKIFAYGRLKAINSGNCGDNHICWGYHVAPLVKVKKIDGSKTDLVIDPSLFPAPVTQQKWFEAMQNQFCCRLRCKKGAISSYEVTNAEQYFPSGETDANYDKTMKTLKRFCKECH